MRFVCVSLPLKGMSVTSLVPGACRFDQCNVPPLTIAPDSPFALPSPDTYYTCASQPHSFITATVLLPKFADMSTTQTNTFFDLQEYAFEGASKMPRCASSQALSARRTAVYSTHRRSDSGNSSSSSRSTLSSGSNSTAGPSSRRTVSPHSNNKQRHAAIVAAANLAAQQATLPKSVSGSKAPFVVQPRPVIFEEEYQDEAISHMRDMEAATLPNLDLMDAQPELRWFMRPYLIDFIVEIHQTFRLRPETLYLTMNIVDRYVSKRIAFKRHYQLIGSAALLIAAKYEDAKDRVPTVPDLVAMCCRAYDEAAFTQMESHILQTLSWQLGHPTAESWLRTFCMQQREEVDTQSVARFLMENTLFHRDFIGIPSSLIASGALMLSRFICKLQPREFDDSEEVASVAQLLDIHVGQHLQDISLILVKKYSYQHFSNASSIVRDFYLTLASAKKEATAPSHTGALLPAHSLSVTVSSGDDSMEDGDCSMQSGSSTPSSMTSTPSRSTYEDEEDEEDDDEDMPVTPLSLNAMHDPLSAESTSPSVRCKQNKENRGMASLPSFYTQPVAAMKPRETYNATKLSIRDRRVLAQSRAAAVVNPTF